MMLPFHGHEDSAGHRLFSLLPANEIEANSRQNEADRLKSSGSTLSLNSRQLHDLELLLNGGFSPLDGFLKQSDFETCVAHSQLESGVFWPIPIVLDIDADNFKRFEHIDRISLLDKDGSAVAIMKLESKWRADKQREADLVYGGSPEHPYVQMLLNGKIKDFYLGGSLLGIKLPSHYDFEEIRLTPAQVRSRISAMKPAPRAVVAFQTRNPLHRAHVQVIREACKRVASYAGGFDNVTLLLHPTVGPTRDGDVPANTRIHCYRAVIPILEGRSDNHGTLVSEGSQTTADGPCLKVEFGLLPLAMRMGGPREALLHAIIRQNYGASHFIVGRDHAGPGVDSKGIPFYADNAAAELALKSEKKFNIRIVESDEMVYCDDVGAFKPKNIAESEGNPIISISGTKLRSILRNGSEIPDWFSYPEVIELLRSMPSMQCQSERGFCVFFTGLSGSGKTTLASALNERLASFHPKILKRRSIQVLDGDECRTWLSHELGFTRADRVSNINRIGRVASLIVEAGGIVFCAAIAPHEEARSAARGLVETVSPAGFIEVHVDAALSVCEQRDRKGLYAKSRNGKLPHFTGVDDVYQRPQHPDLRIDTAKCSVHSAIDQIVQEIERRGFISK